MVEMQAVDALNSFYPMQVIATREETADLQSKHTQANYLVFPEDRANPIKMKIDLPLRWIRRGANGALRGRGPARRVLRVPTGHLRGSADRGRHPGGVWRAHAQGRRKRSRPGDALLQPRRHRLGGSALRPRSARREGTRPAPLVRRPRPGNRAVGRLHRRTRGRSRAAFREQPSPSACACSPP